MHVVERPEVDESQAARSAALDLVDRLPPGFEIELGRRARRQYEAARRNSHSCGVSRVQRAVGIEVGDVMPCVSRSREALETENSVSEGVDVSLGDRSQLSPQRVERCPIQSPRARLELRRVDEVRRADLGDVHLEPRMLAHENARRPGMVQVDVREKQVADVGEVEPTLREPCLQVRDACRRTAVEEREAVLRLEDIAADDALVEVVQVDRCDCQRRHGRSSVIPPARYRDRRSGRGRPRCRPKAGSGSAVPRTARRRSMRASSGRAAR